MYHIKQDVFYLNLSRSDSRNTNTILSRVQVIAETHEFNLLRFVVDDIYALKVINGVKHKDKKHSGVADTITFLLHDFTGPYRDILKLLLLPF